MRCYKGKEILTLIKDKEGMCEVNTITIIITYIDIHKCKT